MKNILQWNKKNATFLQLKKKRFHKKRKKCIKLWKIIWAKKHYEKEKVKHTKNNFYS